MSSSKTVIIYTIPTCPHCQSLKTFLAQNNIEHTERDVSTDPNALAEMQSKTGRSGVPVIVIDNYPVVGFAPERTMELLAA